MIVYVLLTVRLRVTMNVTDAEKFITDQFSRPTSAQAFR